MTTDDDGSKIAGNVSDDIKKTVRSLENALTGRIFGGSVLSRTKVKEVSILAKAEEPERLEGRVVCELDVAEGEQSQCWLFPHPIINDHDIDMINIGGGMHGGCSAFLIDVSVLPPSAFGTPSHKSFFNSCSSLALLALKMSMTPDKSFEAARSVSQSLNIVYHSPAALYAPHALWLVRLVAHPILQGGQNPCGKHHLDYWSESSICTDRGT